MENLNNKLQLEQLIAQAFELLDDVKHKFGMFEHQRYGKLRSLLAECNAPDEVSEEYHNDNQK
ncbi:hypothetical protein [Mucilaginibacter phyllosphaerae]